MSFGVLHSGLIDKSPAVRQAVSDAALLPPCDYLLNVPVNQICGHCVNMACSSGAVRQHVDRQITLKWNSYREALTEKGNKALFGCLSWREVKNWHYFVSSLFRSIHLDGVGVGRSTVRRWKRGCVFVRQWWEGQQRQCRKLHLAYYDTLIKSVVRDTELQPRTTPQQLKWRTVRDIMQCIIYVLEYVILWDSNLSNKVSHSFSLVLKSAILGTQ